MKTTFKRLQLIDLSSLEKSSIMGGSINSTGGRDHKGINSTGGRDHKGINSTGGRDHKGIGL